MELSRHLDWEQAEKQMRPPDFDGAPLEGFVRSMKSWPNLGDLWSEELADMVLSNLVIRDEKVYRRLSIPNHMKIAKAIYDLSTSEMLASLTVPGLAISCERQTQGQLENAWMESRRAGLERLRETAPNVRVVVMEDTIHDVPLQRPNELASLITEFASTVTH
jgi:pimeloyl-ACP methyl ester carboxylesterase